MKVRSPYNYDPDIDSFRSGLTCEDVTRTQQHFKDECDINVLVARFGAGAPIPAPVAIPTEVDFSEVMDFQSAMNAVVQAQRSFESMPSSLRKRFENDPRQFVEFFNDPANADEARRLKLLPELPKASEVPSEPPKEPS